MRQIYQSLIFLLIAINYSSAREPFLGEWQTVINGHEVILRINDDMSGDLDGDLFIWAQKENVLTFYYPSADYAESCLFELSGQRLILYYDGSEPFYFDPSGDPETLKAIKPEVGSLRLANLTDADIFFLRQQKDGSTVLCQYNHEANMVTILHDFDESQITQPALHRDLEMLICVENHATQSKLWGWLNNREWKVDFPTNPELTARHPSLSRDGRQLAFTIDSSQHVGSINVYDWDSGLYDRPDTTAGHWCKIISIDLETGQQVNVFYDDHIAPDVMKVRRIGPVFSPTADILVYADNYRIYVCDALTGKELRQFGVPSVNTDGWTGQALISEISGLAFSPDGQNIAYFSQGKDELASSPHLIIELDIDTGMGVFYGLPGDLSGTVQYGQLATLDYSPDNRFIIFDGSVKGGQVDIYGINRATGECFQLTTDGRSYNCVWKGR